MEVRNVILLIVASVTVTTTIAADQCILLIGGRLTPDVEYFHPADNVECDQNAIGRLSGGERWLKDTEHTSGCYLRKSRQIAIREKDRKPPTVHGLDGAGPIELPKPLEAGSWCSTTAAINPSVCLSCGGSISPRTIGDCFRLDTRVNELKWTPIASLPTFSCMGASVAMDDNTYFVIGGYSSSERKEVYQLNVASNRWSREPSLPIGLYQHAAVRLSSRELLVCGGVRSRRDCHVFDRRRRQWRRVGQLNAGRQTFALVDFQGDIYALGGLTDGNNWVTTVEKYDRTNAEWRVIGKRLKKGRYAFVAEVVDEKSIGGEEEMEFLEGEEGPTVSPFD